MILQNTGGIWMMRVNRAVFVAMICGVVGVSSAIAQERPMVDAGEPFGMLPLVDEVIIGESEATHGFVESAEGISEIQDVLGTQTRVIPNVGDARFFGYRLGVGKGLEAGQAYVLSVDYPEDVARTVYVVNRGGEYARGFATGAALGDTLRGYTANNPESMAYPLAGEHRAWKTLFFLHENYAAQTLQPSGPMVRPEGPGDGFMVYIAQPGRWSRDNGPQRQAPNSAGAAVSRIRLFAVPDPDALSAPVNYPPDDLPRRHLFWREEMSDGAIHQRNNQTAVANEIDWFEHKARLMKFLGMNTYSKDLLEFSANQGWDSSIHGGNDWVHFSDNNNRWSDILEMLGRYDFYVLPMYEYAGSKGDNGLGYETRARPLRRDGYSSGLRGETDAPCDGYTHIWWAERANVDVADPDTAEDLRKILDATILRHKDRVKFLGAWLRTRVSDIPVSFSDFSVNLFNEETAPPTPVTRQMMIEDEAVLETYTRWWFDKRRAFLGGAREVLREALGDDALLLFTAYNAEPGPGVPGGVVTDDVPTWSELVGTVTAWSDIGTGGAYANAALAPRGSWADNSCNEPAKQMFEWEHSLPRPDPANAKDMEGFLFTYPFNRLYTTSDPANFETFRGPAGVAMIRHYALNENVMDLPAGGGSLLGYFVTDVDRAGPYSMLAEARALAYGDPRYIGYLSSQRYNRGFPQYVRRFNSAFLALPAVPSEIWADAASNDAVVVRAYETAAHGTYLAVVNTGFDAVDEVIVTLPEAGTVTDAVNPEALNAQGETFSLSLYPGEVRALVVTAPNPESPDAGAPMPGTDGGGMAPTTDGGGGSPVPGADAGTPGSETSGNSDDGGCRAAEGDAPAVMFFVVLALLGFRRRR